MKRWCVSIATALVATLFVAGCGGSDDGPTLGETKVTRQEVAPALYELAYSPSEKRVYVVSSGSSGDDPEPSKVFWLDADDLKIQGELPLQTSGFGMALDDDANRLYLGNTRDGSVTVVDTDSKKVVTELQLTEKVMAPGRDGEMAERPAHSFRELVLDPSRHRLYLPGMSAESALYVVNTETLELEKIIEGFGANATGITRNPDGSRVYVSTMKGELYTVDADRLAIVSKAEPEGEVLLNLAFDNARNHVLATDRETQPGEDGAPIDPHNDNQVLVIDADSGKTLAHLPSDAGTLAILMDQKRDLLYATNRDGHTVTVYDMGSQEKLRTVDLPTYPNSLALDPASGAVYVSIKNDRDAPAGSAESVARISFAD